MADEELSRKILEIERVLTETMHGEDDKRLVVAWLFIVQMFMHDVGRIADAMETIARNTAPVENKSEAPPAFKRL